MGEWGEWAFQRGPETKHMRSKDPSDEAIVEVQIERMEVVSTIIQVITMEEVKHRNPKHFEDGGVGGVKNDS